MRRLLPALLLFLTCLSQLAAQEPTSALDFEIQRAQRFFDARKYNTAAQAFKKVYPKVKDEENQNRILFMVAESYRRANNFKQAYNWYEKLVNTKYPDPQILYSYGLLLKNFERYEEAARQFNDFLFEKPGDKNAKRELQSCAIATQWKENPEKFTLVNLKTLNTPYSDYAPFYANDQLVWASSRPEATGNVIFEWTGQKCSDFFSARQENDRWLKPANLKGVVNTNFNEGAAWLDTTGSTIYFTQCNGTDGKSPNCKIYEAHYINGIWTNINLLPFNSDSFSVGHPSMTADGRRLYFSSDMPGGMGEKDLYYVDHNPNTLTWGKPVNLGPTVNTNEDDMFPFVDESGKVFFASKGHGGMGGLDLYSTKADVSGFSPAQNLKYPINSGGDDFGLSFIPASKRETGKPIGYLTSNREGGEGDDDLYSLSIKPFLYLVKGTTVDEESNSPLPGARVNITDASGKTVTSLQSGSKGEFTAELPLEVISMLVASKEKYFSSTPVSVSTVQVDRDSTILLTLKLNPIPAADYEFVLQGIYYDLDKFDLRPEAKTVLDSLAAILKNNPTLVIELASHTDSRAPADYNITLSQKRAQSCVTYLTQKGIAKDRLVPVGYGETKLVNDCSDGVDCSEEEHQQNRRTTFRVLRSDYKGR